jgi:hypothetical protein
VGNVEKTEYIFELQGRWAKKKLMTLKHKYSRRFIEMNCQETAL